MKGWHIDRIADLRQWNRAEVDEETDHSIVIAQDVTIEEYIKALGDAEKLPCKFALKVLRPPGVSFDSASRMAMLSSMSYTPTRIAAPLCALAS